MRVLKLPLLLSLFLPTAAVANCGELCGVGFWKHATQEQVQQHLDQGADLNDKRGGQYILHYASFGKPELLKMLLEAGAMPNMTNKTGHTPLHYAARNQWWENIALLLAHGADPNIRNENGETPLFLLSSSEYYSDTPENITRSAALLLEYGADPNIGNADGLLPVHGALRLRYHDLFGMLVEAGADLQAAPDLLLDAAMSKSPEIIVQLVSAGFSVNLQDKDGQTALHRAAIVDAPEVVRALLAAGADPNIRDTNGDTPVLIASKRPLDRNIRL
ncbi:MAG: ankyrin repeat domain-containing protein, partial [Thalassovita sp.]|nr:ankyrin repeat domain-containing protein [Thalassovita sp.]